MSKCKTCSQKFAVSWGKNIVQLLSCLYLYDSGIPVPVRIIKQSRYTGVRRLALTYRAACIPASDATGKFVQSRYTGVRRHREVCAKPVYRFPTSYGLKSQISTIKGHISIIALLCHAFQDHMPCFGYRFFCLAL